MSRKAALSTKARSAVRLRSNCRLCGAEQLVKVWSFGETPLANAYLKPEEVGHDELFVALDVYYCKRCSLVQLRHVVDPEVLFSRYLYVSSTSPAFVAHFERYADDLVRRFVLRGDALVVDVGSNDGVLLRPLKAKGIRVVGIDPATTIATQATVAGIETVPDFFTPVIAGQVREKYGPASVISANNVFAHTDDVAGFMEAVDRLLAEDGAFVFEVQYLGDLIKNNLFDIVYHEHVNYYHLKPLKTFFAACGWEIFDVMRQAVHGGSLRVFVGRAGKHAASPRVAELLSEETTLGLDTLLPYTEFAARVQTNGEKLRALLVQLKAQGKRIVGYGAPAKATTLLYVFRIGAEMLDYIVEDAPLKQGRVMPGSHIPIVGPEQLYNDKPDYCLILAWNFAERIMQTHAAFVLQGGRFILPVSEPVLL